MESKSKMATKSNRMSFDNPQFRILSGDQIEDIHLATLEILRRTGVRIHAEEGLELMRRAGADISDGNLVRIPSRLAEWALDAAPKSITLYTRDGRPGIRAEGRNVYYGNAVSASNIIDPYTAERRPFKKQDVADVARLCDALPNIDFVMGLGVVSDCPIGLADREEFEALVLNTNKPLVGWAYEAEGYADIVEIGIAVRGSLEELQRWPFFALLADPTSPLSHSRVAVQKLLYLAEKNLPNLYLSSPIQSAAAPITPAASVVIANAELISGLVLCQLKREGSPYIFCGEPHPLDLKTTALCLAAPETFITLGALAEVAEYYRLPNFGIAGCTESKVFDEQAAIEGALGIAFAALSGINFVHGLGFLESALTGSLEMLVVQDEVVGMIKRVAQGMEVSEETLAIDLIDQLGPGGHFLDTDHTLRHFRENWYPTLMDRLDYSNWQDTGRKTLRERANEKVRSILENHRPPSLSDETRARIRGVVRRAEELAPK